MKYLWSLVILFFSFSSPLPADTYDETFIALVEYIYGEGFLSQGGAENALSQFSGIDLNGKKMLDIGCGMGGPDRELAKHHSVTIIGIDPDPVLIHQAKNKTPPSKNLKGTVDCQLTTEPFSLQQFCSDAFDIVSSKESLLHIPFAHKQPFFCEIFRVLKPKGQIVIVDWVQKEPFSQTTLDMMAMDREAGVEYMLNTQEDYVRILEKAGFKNIQIENETDAYIQYTNQNLARVQDNASEFKALFGEDNYCYSMTSWDMQKNAFQNREIQVIKIKAEKL